MILTTRCTVPTFPLAGSLWQPATPLAVMGIPTVAPIPTAWARLGKETGRIFRGLSRGRRNCEGAVSGFKLARCLPSKRFGGSCRS